MLTEAIAALTLAEIETRHVRTTLDDVAPLLNTLPVLVTYLYPDNPGLDYLVLPNTR